MLEHALGGDKVSEVDYLTGDDNYKSNWMSHRRERWESWHLIRQPFWES
jgi:hypothetical protein